MKRPTYDEAGSLDYDVAMEGYCEVAWPLEEELKALGVQLKKVMGQLADVQAAVDYVSDCSEDECTRLEMADLWMKLEDLRKAIPPMVVDVKTCFYAI